MIRRVVPDLHAPDPTAGRAFYEEVLGMELAMDLGWVANYVAPGGVRRFFVRSPEGAVVNVVHHR